MLQPLINFGIMIIIKKVGSARLRQRVMYAHISTKTPAPQYQPPNRKNIYGAALALIAIMYGIMQGIIAVASILATMALYGNGRDPQ